MTFKIRKDIDTVLDAADAVRKVSEPRYTSHQKKLDGSMHSETTKNMTYIIPDEETASFAKGLLTSLSLAAMKLAIQIGDELVMNNALWNFDHKNNRSDMNAIKELKEKRIILPLVPHIYYVNPLAIRKGNAVVVTEKTKEIVLEHRGACKEAIIAMNGAMQGIGRPLFHTRTHEINMKPQIN